MDYTAVTAMGFSRRNLTMHQTIGLINGLTDY